MRFAELVLGRHGNVYTICITQAAIWQSDKSGFRAKSFITNTLKSFIFIGQISNLIPKKHSFVRN